MDVAAWLHGLGLGQYEQMFRDHGVDPEVLPHLTADDLRDMGVTAIGHRRKLLQAIGRLRGTPDAPPAAPTAPHAAAPARPPEPTAERRQLTVMFCDLVGSTALAGRLDPEDMGALIRAYQDACAGVITRFEGHVAKYLGDGVLAYFGYPRAHEDAAERAVRAGLGVVEAVGRLSTPDGAPSAARIGIATGLVVVGDLVGHGEAQERAVTGETPNLAARLQALAEPNMVVVGPSTRRLLGGLFECADLGARALKGFAAPVRAWRVLGPSGAEGRFEAHQTGGLTPLVGREHELGLLLDRWHLAREREGQVVLLAGEPGIGKSRLVRALRERLSDEPHTALRYHCSPYHLSSALHPMIAALERGADFHREDDDDIKLDKLEALLARSTEDTAAAVPLIAALLSIPTGDRYPPLDLAPQRQKDETLRALLAQLEGYAAKQPVLVVLEDAHWIDPTTAELFGLAIDRVRDLPVLVVITFRPEFTPPWRGHAHVTPLTLNRLGRRQATAMVERITAGKSLPAEVVGQIAAKTDGVPLFVEELTKAVIEAGFLQEREDRYELTGPLPPLAIPSSLHDSLLARLDRLAPVKEVAQVAACIGREFPHELLAAVAPLAEDGLQDTLDRLIGSELVFRRGAPPQAVYVFKHALVQEAAYQSLLKSRRQQLHARIATVLEERFPRAAEAEPEVLAHHYTQAGLLEPAISYWRKAGSRAIRRSANMEAISHLRTALDLVSALPEAHRRDELELDVRIEMGGPMVATRGYSNPECLELFSKARAIAERLGDRRKLLPALYFQWVYEYGSGRLPTAIAMARDFLDRAERAQDWGLELLGHQSLGFALFSHGRPEQALLSLRRALKGFDPARHAEVVYTYGQNPRVVCLAYAGLALGCQGLVDQALQVAAEAVEEARAMRHFNTLANALFHKGLLHLLLRDGAELEATASWLVKVAEDHAAAAWAANGRALRSCARLAFEAGEEGVAQLHRDIDAVRALRWHLFLPCFEVVEASAWGAVGDGPRGLRLLEEARAEIEGMDQRLVEAEYHRVRAGLLRTTGSAAGDIEAALAQATSVARHQSARTFELRAATDLARFWSYQGRRSEARELLAPVYNWFTEGFGTPDLREARELLEALR